MDRQRTLLVWASVAIVVLAAAAFALWPPAPLARLNLVIVTFDTTRADRIGCYGDGRARTPTLDALGHDGVIYLRCFTPAPVTLPAHASLMTGLTPLRHGIHDNGLATLAPEAETLAEVLGRAGYATAAFVGAFVLDHQYGLAQGFEHYDDDLADGESASELCYAERNARLVTDAALAWLARGVDRPVFLWIHYYDPHAPYRAPGFDPTFSSLTDYDAEISFADSQLKRVVDYFDEHADRPTLLVVAADHGEGLGDHHEATHGHFTYNSTLHVPLIVRFPKREHAGTRIDSPVGLVDVMPSLLDWLHLPAPADVDGRPVPLVARTAPAANAAPRGIYFENYFVADNFGWCPLIGAIWGDMKFIHAPRPELYNLSADRWEEKNLYDPASAASQEMAKKLAGLVADLSARGRFAPQQVAMSAGDLARLQSLGYVGGERAAAAAATAPLDIPPDARDPKDMVAVLEKIQTATIALEQQRPAEAGELLLRIVTTDDPGNPRAVRRLAPLIEQLPEMRPRIVAALADLRTQKAGALDAYALAMLGIGLYEEARYQDAADVLGDVVRAVPQHAAAYRYLGDAHWQLGHKAEAARAYQQAIDLVAPLSDQPVWLPHAREQLERCREP